MLVKATQEGDFATVEELVGSGGVSIHDKNNNGRTALIEVAGCDHVDVVRYLAEQGADKDGELILAAFRGRLDVVRYLVEQGTDKEAKDEGGKTALIAAACFGSLDVVRYLVDQGADKEAKDEDGSTALILAAFRGRLEVVRYLVEQGADKEAKNNKGSTALIWAAYCGSLGVVRYLVEQGADKEAKDNTGSTALILAAYCGSLGVVRYLVEQGADKEAKDNRGNTPLILAADCDHVDVVQYLVEQGADKEAKDNRSKTPLIWAAYRGSLEVVQYLVEQGADKEAKDEDGKTPLILAASHGGLEVVRYLVEQGADKEAKDGDGSTAPILAASGCHLNVIHCLTQQCADVSCLNKLGNSVLMQLLQSDNAMEEDNILATVKLLLDHGTPLQSNKQGKGPKSIARRKKFNDVIDLLEEYAIKPRREQVEESPSWVISYNDIKRGVALAQGGVGTVYRAEWAHIDVVVKEISVVEIRRFLKEVKTWRELTHDNVVPFYGANHREEPYFIVSKYASNGDLVPYLKREKEQGRVVVWRKLKEVASGLSYLHHQGIVHGYLKGNNIVISSNGTAMLTADGLWHELF
ncbi:hypothetical protein DVH05_002015 [Phytophthora capsici]|nr:hypothetical protein DVH05_002015 [Phytophthora capsici]